MKKYFETVKNSILNPILIMYAMLIISFFSQIAILYTPLGIVRKLILVWGIILLVYIVFKNRGALKNRYSFLLMLFCISNCISVIVNFSERFVFGMVTMVYVFMYLVIFFNATNWNEKIAMQKEKILDNLLTINIALSFLTAICALVMFVFNINGVYISGDDTIFWGMRENRLWGLYNANTAATICIISIVCSFIQLKKNKHTKVLIANIVMQTIYLILTQSRTGWILLMVFAVLYLFFNKVLPVLKSNVRLGQKLLRSVYAIGVLAILWICPTVAKEVLVKIPQAVVAIIEMTNSDWEDGEEITLDRVDEEFVDQQDVTNGRAELWKAGIEIIKEHPVFGIGSENIIKETEQYLSEARYQNLVKGGFHNSYLAVMVSSGIAGTVLFVAFLFMLVIDGLKYLWKGGAYKYSLIIMLLFTLMVNELMEARWLYNTSYINIAFWIFAGVAVNGIRGEKRKC